MPLGQLKASHMAACGHGWQGCWQRRGTAGPGAAASVASLLGSAYLPLPFLCLCFPFVSFKIFFNSLSFPLNDEKKNDSHRTQRIPKGRKARIIGLVPFHLFFLLSFLLFVL